MRVFECDEGDLADCVQEVYRAVADVNVSKVGLATTAT